MFGLITASEEQVSNILSDMTSNKATGWDNPAARFVKDGSSIISKPLTHIVNISIQTGNIPDDLKMARIVPLVKKKNKADAGNYRLLSVLSNIYFKKLRVVFNQVNTFLIEQNVLYDLQSGFRSFH